MDSELSQQAVVPGAAGSRPAPVVASAGSTRLRALGKTGTSGRAVSVALVAVGVVAASAVLILHGVDLTDVVRYAGYVLGYLLVPGFLVSRALFGSWRTWLAEAFMAVCVSVALQLGAWAVTVGTGAPELLRFWPLVTFLVFLVPAFRRRLRVGVRGGLRTGEQLVVTASLLSVLVVTHRALFAQLPLPGQGRTIYQDMLWHLGLVHEARRAFPLLTPQVIDAGALKYHWFSDAHMAAGTLVGAASPNLEVLRFFPVLFVVLGFLTPVVLVREFTRSRWAVVIAAPLSAATGTYLPFSKLYQNFSSYIALSPSQMFAVPLMGAALLAIWRALQGLGVGRVEPAKAEAGERLTGGDALGTTAPVTPPSPSSLTLDEQARSMSSMWTASIGVVLLGLALTGAKASATPTVLGGVGMLWAWAMLAKRARVYLTALGLFWAALVALALTTVAGGDGGAGKQLFAFLAANPAYRYFVGSRDLVGWQTAQETWIIPRLAENPVAALAIFGYLALAMTPFIVAILAMLSVRPRRNDPALWLMGGCVLAAMLALSVLRSPALNQLYFARGALQIAVAASSLWAARRLEVRSELQRRRIGWMVSGVFLLAATALLADSYQWYATRARFSLLQASLIALTIVVASVLIFARRARLPLWSSLAFAALAATASQTLVQPLTQGKGSHAGAISDVRRDQQKAGAWIHRHVPENDLLATNVQCLGKLSGLTCDSRSWWVSGLGGRRVLVEGWAYVPGSDNGQPFFAPRLLAQNQRAFEQAAPDALTYLHSRGVRYLVAQTADAQVSPRLSERAQRVYSTGSVTIYRLPE